MNLETMFKKSTGSTALTFKDVEDQPNEWVTEVDGIAVADSRVVAKVFAREHKTVLRAIEDIKNDMYPVFEERQGKSQSAHFYADYPDNAIQGYFIEHTYQDGRNRSQKMYCMTRQGFSLLVMGFTGQKALMWKLKFIEKFDAMEAYISSRNKPAGLDAAEVAAIAAQAATQTILQVLPDILKTVQPPSVPQPTQVDDARLAMLPDTLSVRQVQIYLGISTTRVYDIFNSDDFPAYKVGHKLYVSKTNFVKWLTTVSRYGIFIG